MKLILAVVFAVSSLSAQIPGFGNATSLRGKNIKNPLTCSDTFVLTWVAANSRFECLAGGGGGGSGTVTSVGLSGTTNQITVTGATPITGAGAWTLSFPAGGVTLPGTTTGTFSGGLTGNVTGNASGSAGTVTSIASHASTELSDTAAIGYKASPLSQFAATTSAQLRGVISDETGTGVAYFQGGDLGTPSAGLLTNATGLPAAAVVAGTFGAGNYTVTGNLTATGSITSGSGSGVSGAIDLAQGTLPAIVANTISFVAPTSVTGYEVVAPGAAATGVRLWTNAANVITESIITPGGACTNQFVRSISALIVPTCATIALADTPLTTKGDLLGVSTVLGRLAVGSDGQVLTADAASTLGIKWAAAAASGANAALSNLASVSINAALIPQTTLDLGAAATAWRNLYIYGQGTFGSHSIKFDGTPTGNRVVTFPDATDTVAELGQANAFTAAQSISIATSTTTQGLSVATSTPATSGNQKFSPFRVMSGNGWGTGGGTSQAVAFKDEVQPIQGASPTARYVLSSNINGGAYTARLTIDSGGVWTTPDGITAAVFCLTQTAGSFCPSGNRLTFGATAAAGVTLAGHLQFSGTSPAIASGFGSSPSIVGSDQGGTVTVGTGGIALTGVINFGGTWNFKPACAANDDTTLLFVQATPNAGATTLTLTSAAPWTAGDKISWVCTGSPN